MLKRPEKKNFSTAEVESILTASREQTGKAQAIKSYDKDFPVFEVPINDKVLAYIPNHVIQNPDGTVTLRTDKFGAHPYQIGREFGNIRCISGIMTDDGAFDGSCPACDAVSESWTLFNYEFNELAASRGYTTIDEAANAALKEDKKKLLESRAMKAADIWYTFPIVVIDCDTDAQGNKTTKPKLDAEGRMHGTPMWYSIREKTFLEKWIAGLDAVDVNGETPTNPAGLWAVLNFTYQSKDGKHDKMQSAKNLKVTYRNPDPALAQWESYFDNLTVDWTPAKAAEVVVLDAIRDVAESREAVDTIMKGTRERIAMYDITKSVSNSGNATAPAGITAGSQAQALANFGVVEPTAGDAPANVGVVAMGEMPVGVTQ